MDHFDWETCSIGKVTFFFLKQTGYHVEFVKDLIKQSSSK